MMSFDNNGRDTSLTQSVTDPWMNTITTATTASVTQNVIRFDFPETSTANYVLIDPELLKKPDPYWPWAPYAPVRAWRSQCKALVARHVGRRARRRVGREPRRCGRSRGSWRRRARR